MSCANNHTLCGVEGSCGPLGKCQCNDYFLGDFCEFDTRSAKGEAYFEIYRIVVATLFLICFAWGCICLWRISHKFASCNGYRSSRPLCIIFVTTGTLVRFLMNAIDPECWTGVLPWRVRVFNSLGLVLITSAYSCQILVWIHLQRRLRSDPSVCGTCCARVSPALLAFSTVSFLLFTVLLTILAATGVISEFTQGTLYITSLAMFFVVIIGCSVYFGGRIIIHFRNARKRTSKTPLIAAHKDKALGAMSRYVGINFLVGLGGMGVFVVVPTGWCAIDEVGPCYLTFFAGFRFFELVACVFVLIAVGIRRKKLKVVAEAVNLDKGDPLSASSPRRNSSSNSDSGKSTA